MNSEHRIMVSCRSSIPNSLTQLIITDSQYIYLSIIVILFLNYHVIYESLIYSKKLYHILCFCIVRKTLIKVIKNKVLNFHYLRFYVTSFYIQIAVLKIERNIRDQKLQLMLKLKLRGMWFQKWEDAFSFSSSVSLINIRNPP